MSNLESNKIFAALLVAGITGMMTGFIANKVVKSEDLKEDAFPIEVADSLGGAAVPEKPKGPEPILAMLADADITRGERLSKACAACHSFDKGGANRIGPNLWNVVNASKGAHDGFTYSSTMAAFGGQWGYQELNHFLWKPKDYMPGTKMNYIGLRKPEDRADMIAWMRTLHDTPPALPSAEAIAAETVGDAVEEMMEDLPEAMEAPVAEEVEEILEDAVEETPAPQPEIEQIIDEAMDEAAAIIDFDPSFDPATLNAIETAAGDDDQPIEPTATEQSLHLDVQGTPVMPIAETPVIETDGTNSANGPENATPETPLEQDLETIEPATGVVTSEPVHSMEEYIQHMNSISNTGAQSLPETAPETPGGAAQ